MDILKLQNLSKYYTTQSSVVMGLSSVNLSFSVGEFVAITGESGSGKSTLAHVLGGILPYESGELYINGRPTSHYDASDWERYRRDTVSFISQSYGILAGNTVLENVVSALRLCGVDKGQAAQRAKTILKEVELYEYKSRRAGKLSSGQKQRLSIARALAKPSRILIADEPTGNLDRENSEKVISLLKRASADRLVILITHEFEEAKDVATRRVILADGLVVTDARLREPAPRSPETEAGPAPAKAPQKRKPLTPYITALTTKARPVFSSIVCLLLALTTFMTFVFLGNFLIAWDDTNTRIYNTDAFFNGDPTRIVVMKNNGESFTEADYESILSVKYTETLEKWGYCSDINYYYRENTDYVIYQDILMGPNYHPVGNPDDYQVTDMVKFIETYAPYLQTVPPLTEDILTAGAYPEGFYEVLSADPSLKVGDTVTVYFRNKADWSVSAYIALTCDVVGETSFGSGLYFSDRLGAALSAATRADTGDSFASAYICAPYDPRSFTLTAPKDEEPPQITLTDDQFIFPVKNTTAGIDVGSVLTTGETETPLLCVATYESTYNRLLLVTEATFDALTDTTPSNQISLFIKDYAYADRVMEDLGDLGYVTLSPFQLGATDVDPDLASERLVTLEICLAALALTVILQFILIRAMFSSLYEHFRLLSNIGLTAKTAYAVLSLLFLAATVIGELLGGALILGLNGMGFERVVNIFKYLDADSIVLLFTVHFLSVIPALLLTLRSTGRAVFAQSKRKGDLDFTMMEEVEDA